MDVVYLLEPYSNNEVQRLIKTPKLYFCDTGLCAYLTRWLTSDSLREGAASGHLYENYVVMELVKNYAYREILDCYFMDEVSDVQEFVVANGYEPLSTRSA